MSIDVEVNGETTSITCGEHGVDVRGTEALGPAIDMLIERLAGVTRGEILIAVAKVNAA